MVCRVKAATYRGSNLGEVKIEEPLKGLVKPSIMKPMANCIRMGCIGNFLEGGLPPTKLSVGPPFFLDEREKIRGTSPNET